VFKQHDRIGHRVLDAKPPKLALQFKRPAVLDPAQAEQPDAAPTG